MAFRVHSSWGCMQQGFGQLGMQETYQLDRFEAVTLSAQVVHQLLVVWIMAVKAGWSQTMHVPYASCPAGGSENGWDKSRKANKQVVSEATFTAEVCGLAVSFCNACQAINRCTR
jgi:hypothetical protein